MKKIILLSLFILFIFHPAANAAEKDPTPSPVNYELPYPGIMPDSPLYTFKLLKEKVSDLLISDPATKADFYLLQSNKRLAASIIFFENGNQELGEKTLSKSLDYHEKAINKMLEAKNAQDNVSGVFGQIKDSCRKHEEEIERLKKEEIVKKSDLMTENEMRFEEMKNRVKTFSP